MRVPSFLLCVGAVSFFGAGCVISPITTSTRVAQPILSEDHLTPIPQHLGFGQLPPAPLVPVRPGASGNVRILTKILSIPPNVTVLRFQSGNPNATTLQHMTSALGAPDAALGKQPVARAIDISWHTEDGGTWRYHPEERRLTFLSDTFDQMPLTVRAWPDRSVILGNVIQFMSAKGLSRTDYLQPAVDPDWEAWARNLREQATCVSRGSLDEIRAAARSTTLEQQPSPPPVPAAPSSDCAGIELPSRIAVQFDASQDTQPIVRWDASYVRGATVILDARTSQVVAGSFTLHTDPDRSDYPSISLETAQSLLGQGGLGGIPRGNVLITKTSFEWLRVDDAAHDQYFLYPVLVGTGTITATDGRTSPYRIVVPLVRT